MYALNDEFKSILREAKNGMVSPMTYVLAKSVMVMPVIYIFSLFALIIPGFLIQNYPWEVFGQITVLWSIMFFCLENVAECLAVWIEDPIIGMLLFMIFWCKDACKLTVLYESFDPHLSNAHSFLSRHTVLGFLFSGNFLAEETLYWPL